MQGFHLVPVQNQTSIYGLDVLKDTSFFVKTHRSSCEKTILKKVYIPIALLSLCYIIIEEKDCSQE